MLSIEKENIKLDVQPNSAIEAITMSGNLLVEMGCVTDNYVESMIKGFSEIGPYIVLAPGIAIPHARPDQGALKTGVAILRLKKPINFGHEKNDPVQIVCAISGVGDNGHLKILQEVAGVLGDKAKYKRILKAKDYDELSQIINSQEGN